MSYYLSIISELYLSYREKQQVEKMQGLNKIGIDLLFCFIIGFLIIQASNSAQQNEEISNLLSIESNRITSNAFGTDY